MAIFCLPAIVSVYADVKAKSTKSLCCFDDGPKFERPLDLAQPIVGPRASFEVRFVLYLLRLRLSRMLQCSYSSTAPRQLNTTQHCNFLACTSFWPFLLGMSRMSPARIVIGTGVTMLFYCTCTPARYQMAWQPRLEAPSPQRRRGRGEEERKKKERERRGRICLGICLQNERTLTQNMCSE